MEYLDLTPWRCPEPLIRLKLWLREAKRGQAVTIMLADTVSKRDLPIYLQQQGHAVELHQLADQTLSLLLVVDGKSSTPSL